MPTLTTPPARQLYSLRRHLLAAFLLATTAIWLAVAVAGYFLARHETDELFDDQLKAFAHSLLDVAAHGGSADYQARPAANNSKNARDRIRYTVWQRQNPQQAPQIILSSSIAAPTPSPWPERENQKKHLVDLVWQGETWRSYLQVQPERGLYIQVLENSEAREELSREYAWRLLWPLLLGLPLLAVLIHLLVDRAMRPFARLAGELQQRSPDDNAPVCSGQRTPVEIESTLQALDHLFGRVGEAIASERRFTADAGHELRTPLAAIRLHAQVAQSAQQAHKLSDAGLALGEVIAATDRATHVAEQLLLLARLTPEQVHGGEQTDLVGATRQACADLASHHRGRELAYSGEETALLAGNPALLYTLIRNLVDNALRYSQADDLIQIAVRRTADGGYELTVSDHGPGIAAELRQQACQRFARLDRRSGDGCGLGLSIVARIAELHGARLSLRDTLPGATLPGLQVSVSFPGTSK